MGDRLNSYIQAVDGKNCVFAEKKWLANHDKFWLM